MRNILSILTGLLFFSFSLFAQTGKIKGEVYDKNGNPIIGANIILVDNSIGSASNWKGEFEITNLREGEYQLKVSMIGYSEFISETFEINNETKFFTITLEEKSLQYDQVVITAGKHEQNISDLPVSATVIGADQFSKKNFTQLDDALRYVPGVNVTLDQVSIRGSSGYSRGAGTRVLVAIDGIPLYTGDSGEIIWEMIPVTDLERVEIIKGAASSLYGSTAIGGVINVITREINQKPLTFVKSFVGAYDKPYYDDWNWSDEYRMFNGLSVAHSRRISKLGFAVSLSRYENSGYRQNDWQKRYSGYLKTKYSFDENTSLTFLATGFSRDRATFNFWKDSKNALRPPDNDLGERTPSNRYILGLTFKNKTSPDLEYKIIGSYYNSYWHDQSESANSSRSQLLRGELQTSYSLSGSAHLVTGFEGSTSIVKSNIFTDPSAHTFGIYSQLEYEFSFPLTVTAGARYDYSKLDTLKGEQSLSPKLGLNYKLTNKTILRGSFGKGFRAPTLAEAFTSTSASGVTVKPNPSVKPETNYSFELGLNHKFSDQLSVDAAIFQNEYYDLIEINIDPSDLKVFFGNVTRARIQGFEIFGNFNLDHFNVEFNSGYTYLWARDIQTKRSLKYRPRHILYSSINYSPGFLSFGIDFRYWSKVEEIDDLLIETNTVPDGYKRSEVFVLDFRTGINLYSFGLPARVFLNIENLLNYNYVEMIGNVSPIRNISLNLEFLF
ncbi:MAG: TonB-dependent receptor [Melioribacteraceae bacterium]|nr:TonB-dependent receptor [Melioribacteraceae bacterium]